MYLHIEMFFIYFLYYLLSCIMLHLQLNLGVFIYLFSSEVSHAIDLKAERTSRTQFLIAKE